MTKKVSPGDCGVVVVYDGSIGVVCVVVADFAVLFFFVVVFDPAADAEPATSTAAATPSENIASVIAAAAATFRRRGCRLTTRLRCRSPVPPESRSLPGAGRAGLRSRCVPLAPP